MPKKNTNKGKGEPNDGEKDDSIFKKTKKKAAKSRRKNVKVWLPAIIKKPHKTAEEQFEQTDDTSYTQEPDEEMSEHEISYKDALLIVEIEKLAAKGLNNDQIIAEIGLSRATFYERLANEPYFAYALHRHRGVARLNVENALYNNAVGFKYKEEQGTAMGLVVTVEKYKLPETRAQEIYLYNRDKETWRKKVEPTVDKGKSISHIGVTLKRRG